MCVRSGADGRVRGTGVGGSNSGRARSVYSRHPANMDGKVMEAAKKVDFRRGGGAE